jgi:hypothetical protein
MELIKHNLQCMYYKNLETYANKHKIEIILPKNMDLITDTVLTQCESETSPTEVKNTETETEQKAYSDITDDYIYKKPWNKLNVIHKIIKMKEFVNNLTIDDVEMKKHLKNQLVLMIKNKQLTKKNDVEYDHHIGRIISIPQLKYKDNTFITSLS